MFEGLRTVIYPVSDLVQAKAWYARVLNLSPYFDEPFYVGFNVEGYELGLQPKDAQDQDLQKNEGEKQSASAPTVVTYWGVPDAHAAFQRLIELGATAHEPVQDVGGDILVASVRDPFGNVVGIIQNPHFVLPG